MSDHTGLFNFAIVYFFYIVFFHFVSSGIGIREPSSTGFNSLMPMPIDINRYFNRQCPAALLLYKGRTQPFFFPIHSRYRKALKYRRRTGMHLHGSLRCNKILPSIPCMPVWYIYWYLQKIAPFECKNHPRQHCPLKISCRLQTGGKGICHPPA